MTAQLARHKKLIGQTTLCYFYDRYGAVLSAACKLFVGRPPGTFNQSLERG